MQHNFLPITQQLFDKQNHKDHVDELMLFLLLKQEIVRYAKPLEFKNSLEVGSERTYSRLATNFQSQIVLFVQHLFYL